MKFLRLVFVAALLLFICVIWLAEVPFTPPEETFVDFPSGTSSAQIAQQLSIRKIIRSRYAFLAIRLVEKGTLKAGEYRFADRASALDIYRRIRAGDVFTQTLIIPEGFNLYQIGAAVEALGLGSQENFVTGAHQNADLLAPSAKSLEGYLYPDTYRFGRHTSIRAMQEAMVRRFRAEAQVLNLNLASTHAADIVILASLVEKEVHFDEERAMAAGVFRNRLLKGMPLQTDPTVIYAALLAHHWTGQIHRSDLDRDSPYNTYVHTGLPPGPICSPGAAALRAAMNPRATDDLYFVADGAGHTQFAATLAEHSKNVIEYRKRTP